MELRRSNADHRTVRTLLRTLIVLGFASTALRLSSRRRAQSGGAERPLFRYFNSELEKHFTVVCWEQRARDALSS
jgi:hypothetical protein